MSIIRFGDYLLKVVMVSTSRTLSNGKEYDSMHGLNQYGYSARYYDPANIRFTTMDPHSENYYSWSPYAYVANNPMKLIDPTGMDWFVNNEDGNLFFLKGVSELTQEHREKYNLGTASYERIGSGDDAMGIGLGYKKNTFEDNGKTYTFNTFPKKGDSDYDSSSLLLDQDFVALYGESEDIASRQGFEAGIRGVYKETLFEYTSAGFSEPAGLSSSTTPKLIGKEQRTYTHKNNFSVKEELSSDSYQDVSSSSKTSVYRTIRPLDKPINSISNFDQEKTGSFLNLVLSTISSFF